MSLLMDALRRAEQEKKLQQARDPALADAEADTDSALPDHPALQRAGPEQHDDDRLDSVGEGPEFTDRAGDATRFGDNEFDLPGDLDDDFAGDLAGDLDLNDSSNFSLTKEFESLAQAELDSSQVLMASDGLSLEPLEPTANADAGVAPELLESTSAEQQTPAEHTQTMPSARALESDLNAYFDQSQSVEIPRPVVHPGDVTLEDVAAHTVVGAQTVFAAGEAPRSNRVFVVSAIVALVIVLGIGGVGLFYAQQSAGPRYLPPPIVADGVERPELRQLPLVEPEPAAAVVTTEPMRIDVEVPAPPGDRAETAGTDVSAKAGPNPPEAGATVVAQTSADRPSAPLSSSASNALGSASNPAGSTNADPAERASPTTPLAAPGLGDNQPAKPPAGNNPPVAEPEYGIGVGTMTIARSVTQAALDPGVERGFSAYQAGDWAGAKAGYQATLVRHPNHRDALLGLAAVALAEGNERASVQHYQDVLSAYPGDTVATAALLGLIESQGPQSAARLRMMLDSHADAPYIHFALANWYARQGRWGDAQQAYFDAVRLAPNNPDYVYNLAVSLDQMGQAKAALTYYQQALTLADNGEVNFSPSAVLARIQALPSAASR